MPRPCAKRRWYLGGVQASEIWKVGTGHGVNVAAQLFLLFTDAGSTMEFEVILMPGAEAHQGTLDAPDIRQPYMHAWPSDRRSL